MTVKIKDEPSCGITDLRNRMIERVYKRTMKEEERNAIDEALSYGECENCGHVRHDWLFAWFTPEGDMFHICDAKGQGPRGKSGRTYSQIKADKEVHLSWLLLDLVAYTMESPSRRKP